MLCRSVVLIPLSFYCMSRLLLFSCFFFNATATTEIYTLSLHDALPIGHSPDPDDAFMFYALTAGKVKAEGIEVEHVLDRKSTRLNSSHVAISYAVFCLKKKKKTNNLTPSQHNQRREHLAPIHSSANTLN